MKKIIKKINKKNWEITSKDRVLLRSNKQSAGITQTVLQKNITKLKSNVLKLSVHGTLDSLASTYCKISKQGKCPCCGHMTGKFVLSDYGKKLLNKYKKISIN